MKKIFAIIQARFGSTRLPGKVLFDLEGMTVLERVLERVKRSKFIDEAVVATTVSKEDLKIIALCSQNGVRVYAGSENDVLDRYFQAARLIGARNIVRITADSPLIDYQVIDKGIGLHLAKNADYTANIIKESYPDGEDVEILTLEALKYAWENARWSSEREHVTPYIRKHPELFKLVSFSYKDDFSFKRWTLDQKEDYEFIKLIYKKLCKKNRYFGMAEILRLLEKYPQYEKINIKIGRNNGYLKSLKEDKILRDPQALIG